MNWTPDYCLIFTMVVFLSSYLIIDIDSDQGIPVYWPSSGVSTYLITVLLPG